MTVESWSTSAPSRTPTARPTRQPTRPGFGGAVATATSAAARAPLATVVGVAIATVLIAPWYVALALVVALPLAARAEWRSSRIGASGPQPVASPAVIAFTLAGAGLVLASLLTASATDRLPLHGLALIGQFALVPLCGLAHAFTPRRADTTVAIWAGAAAGSVLAGSTAFVQVVVAGAQRADGSTNAIAFGDLSLLLVALAITLGSAVPASLAVAPDRAVASRTITTTAAVFGLSAVVLSGSRGPLLAVPVLLAWAIAHHRARITLSGAMRATAVGTAVVALASAIGGGVLVDRLRTAVWEVRVYRTVSSPTDAAAGTSIGARFEAWRAAAETFFDHPLLGVGWGNLRGSFGMQVLAGERNPRIAGFDHAHQQVLSTLASVGILGGLASLAVVALPAIWFWRAWRTGDDADRSVGLAGLVVVSGYAVFGTTEAILEGFAPIMWFALVVTALLSRLGPSAQVDGAGDR